MIARRVALLDKISPCDNGNYLNAAAYGYAGATDMDFYCMKFKKE